MAKFVFIYSGGQPADTPQAQEQAMQAWGAWFGGLGDAVTDTGNPFGGSASVSPDGTGDHGTLGANGYTVVSAGSLAEASAMAKNCPLLESNGTVDVYEAVEM
jgi:hypothetical protein